MIKLLGFKRAVTLGVLLFMNLAIAGLYFFVVDPMREEAQQKLNATKAEISTAQDKINSIKAEMQTFKETLPIYQSLGSKGFYSAQDRFDIERMLKTLQASSGVTSFSFLVGDIKEVPKPELAAANLRLIGSKISLNSIASPFDMNMFALAQNINLVLPMHMRIRSMSVKRASPSLSAQFLEDVKAGKRSPITGEVVFDWFTMVPVEKPAAPGGLPQ